MKDILKILNTGLLAVDGERVVLDTLKISRDKLKIKSQTFDLSRYSNIYVIGAGKVAGKMTLGAEKALGDRISDGVVIVKEKIKGLKKIDQILGSHPVPDQKSLSAGMKLLKLARKAQKNNLVIFLLSGGASSLTVAPEGVSLAEKQKLTKLLLECGADIKEINTIRKHLSEIKGGGLARAIYPATCVTLIISDVLDNDLSVIGSGPTVEDKTTYANCVKIMKKYDLDKKSQKVLRYFKQALETRPVKNNRKVFSKIHNYVIADLGTALSAAQKEAQKLGYKIKMLDRVSGVASKVGQDYAKKAMSLKSQECIISGGETTVYISGEGKGGRNLELVLGFLKNIKDPKGIEFLSINTDGEDGTSDVAGAQVTEKEFNKVSAAAHLGGVRSPHPRGERSQQLRKLCGGINIEDYLKNNNSLAFFQKTSEIIKIPKNQTNVGDIQVMLRK